MKYPREGQQEIGHYKLFYGIDRVTAESTERNSFVFKFFKVSIPSLALGAETQQQQQRRRRLSIVLLEPDESVVPLLPVADVEGVIDFGQVHWVSLPQAADNNNQFNT